MSDRGKRKKNLNSNEVCRLLDLKPYELRYWETEFSELSGDGNQPRRAYDEAEVALLRRIKSLRYEEGYTIAGVKKKLAEEASRGGPAAAESVAEGADGAEVVEVAETTTTSLDTKSAERIKTLRCGVEGALKEARSILRLLDSKP